MATDFATEMSYLREQKLHWRYVDDIIVRAIQLWPQKFPMQICMNGRRNKWLFID